MTETPSETAELLAALRREGVAEVRGDAAIRAAYSSDASLYRVPPRAVAFPRNADEVSAAVSVARACGVPVTARGAGTSVAGNAIGPGLVLDLSRHMDSVLRIDAEERTAVVQPGVVQAHLQARAAPVGLRFGPDPSTHSRCTIGGMIGNDACGSRSLGYGRTSHNVAGLTAVTGTGEVLRTGLVTDGFDAGREALRALVEQHLAPIRTELGRFGRQISGYALHHLLPERGFDLTRMLVGSEGTLAITTEATVRLVVDPPVRVLVVLGYDDIASAGDAVPAILPHRPSACEGLDSRIVDVLRERRGRGAVPALPEGAAWLFVEFAGNDRTLLGDRCRDLIRAAGARSARIVDDPSVAAALWRIREDGAGLAGTAPSGRPAWPGWEDAAVPPDRLGRYLREFDALVGEFGLTSMPFGHFGDGCIHVRLDFPLHSAGGVARVTEFLRAAATLVVGHGGSLSGEHGDGRARSELLSLMYSPEMLRLFGAVKHVFDPGALLNPGVLVDPAPVGDSLRLPAPTLRGPALTLAYSGDSGDFSRAVHRCTGVGKCRSTVSRPDSVMCPSYIATANELDSTRGRARVLQELVNGELVEGWRSPVLHEALDLCLACKGCASDCPTGIDLASYKAEALHQRHRRRLRPRSHYSLGWLPRWARLAGRLPRLANRVAGLPLVGRAALAVAGVDRRRSVPRFAPSSFRRMDRRNRSGSERGRPVVVFVDTFSDHFSPTVVADLVRVLETAGYRPMLSSPEVCCGLTWISTGQLTAARRILGRSIDLLVEEVRRGTPIVGVEPSCTAVLRHDAPELLGTPEAREVAAATRTLAELLAETPDWSPPSLAGLTAVAQPHCHHHAVMGWETDARLLAGLGATVTRVGGCCGLAGNFGVERGHYDISVAVAGQQLLPAVEAAPPDDVVLADGFSCRTQLADLTGRRAHHLAEILARRLPGED